MLLSLTILSFTFYIYKYHSLVSILFKLCSYLFELYTLKLHIFELCSYISKSCPHIFKPYVFKPLIFLSLIFLNLSHLQISLFKFYSFTSHLFELYFISSFHFFNPNPTLLDLYLWKICLVLVILVMRCVLK